MPFAYYRRLTPGQKLVYRRSDAVTTVALPDAGALAPLARELETALAGDAPRHTQEVSRALADGILDRLGVARVAVVVYAVRPSRSWGELHGLYEPAPHGARARASRP